MAKLMTFIMMTVGTILLLNLAGLTTTTGWILGQLGISIGEIQNFSATGFYVAMTVAIGLLVSVSGIRIGTLGQAPTTSIFAAAGASIPLAALIGDLVSIVIQVSPEGSLTWISYVMFLIVTPLIFGYMIALFDWARGNDT